jgi:hypothetical protein
MSENLGDRIRRRRDATQGPAKDYTDAMRAAVQKYVDAQIAKALTSAHNYTDTAVAKLAADNNLTQ